VNLTRKYSHIRLTKKTAIRQAIEQGLGKMSGVSGSALECRTHGENSLQTHENPSLSYLSKPLPISTDHFRISLQQCYMAKKSIGHFQEGIDHEGPIH